MVKGEECMVKGRMHGERGACMAKRGMHGEGRCAW